MPYYQTTLTLPAKPRGVHLITKHVADTLTELLQQSASADGHNIAASVGLVHLFLQHTSASLAINENADPDVRLDTEDWLTALIPDYPSSRLNQTGLDHSSSAHPNPVYSSSSQHTPKYRHTLEGPDDLPAHFKSMLLGVNHTIPLIDGKLGLGTWQGLYLCEHRNHASNRRLVITVHC